MSKLFRKLVINYIYRFHNNEHGNSRAIFARVKHLLRFVSLRIKIVDFDLPKYLKSQQSRANVMIYYRISYNVVIDAHLRLFIGFEVNPVDNARGQKWGELIKHFGVFFITAVAHDCAQI